MSIISIDTSVFNNASSQIYSQSGVLDGAASQVASAIAAVDGEIKARINVSDNYSGPIRNCASEASAIAGKLLSKSGQFNAWNSKMMGSLPTSLSSPFGGSAFYFGNVASTGANDGKGTNTFSGFFRSISDTMNQMNDTDIEANSSISQLGNTLAKKYKAFVTPLIYDKGKAAGATLLNFSTAAIRGLGRGAEKLMDFSVITGANVVNLFGSLCAIAGPNPVSDKANQISNNMYDFASKTYVDNAYNEYYNDELIKKINDYSGIKYNDNIADIVSIAGELAGTYELGTVLEVATGIKEGMRAVASAQSYASGFTSKYDGARNDALMSNLYGLANAGATFAVFSSAGSMNADAQYLYTQGYVSRLNPAYAASGAYAGLMNFVSNMAIDSGYNMVQGQNFQTAITNAYEENGNFKGFAYNVGLGAGFGSTAGELGQRKIITRRKIEQAKDAESFDYKSLRQLERKHDLIVNGSGESNNNYYNSVEVSKYDSMNDELMSSDFSSEHSQVVSEQLQRHYDWLEDFARVHDLVKDTTKKKLIKDAEAESSLNLVKEMPQGVKETTIGSVDSFSNTVTNVNNGK